MYDFTIFIVSYFFEIPIIIAINNPIMFNKFAKFMRVACTAIHLDTRLLFIVTTNFIL